MARVIRKREVSDELDRLILDLCRHTSLRPCTLVRSYSTYGLSPERFDPAAYQQYCVLTLVQRRAVMPSPNAWRALADSFLPSHPFLVALRGWCESGSVERDRDEEERDALQPLDQMYLPIYAYAQQQPQTMVSTRFDPR